MKNYYVTFEYTLEVEADDQQQAHDLAWSDWINNWGTVSPVDFVSSEPEKERGAE